MRKVREVLRLHFECGCKHRQISAACGVSPSIVTDYLERARRTGMTWEQARTLKDSEVEARLFTLLGRSEPAARTAIDLEWVHRELARVGSTSSRSRTLANVRPSTDVLYSVVKQ
jgi:DNA-binding transcriptional regulator LsrR (DeoR family)